MATKRELKQLVERVTAAPGYTRLVGTRVISVDAGKVAMGVDHRPDLVQASGYFHGGVIAGLADHAAGAAVTTALPAGRFAITANLQINFLAPAKGDTLVARAQAVQSGRTLGVAQIDVVCIADGVEERCAIATATMRAIEMPDIAQGV